MRDKLHHYVLMTWSGLFNNSRGAFLRSSSSGLSANHHSIIKHSKVLDRWKIEILWGKISRQFEHSSRTVSTEGGHANCWNQGDLQKHWQSHPAVTFSTARSQNPVPRALDHVPAPAAISKKDASRAHCIINWCPRKHAFPLPEVIINPLLLRIPGKPLFPSWN